MSKAKELATKIRRYIDGRHTSWYFGGVRHEMYELLEIILADDAVLSEPEPERKELATYIERLKEELLGEEDEQKSTWYLGAMFALGKVQEQLSEPEPLKGWIEVAETTQGSTMAINILNIEWFSNCRIRIIGSSATETNMLWVKESYDEIKQKIKEAL